MPRNMSFAMTTEQFRNRTKTVTRRLGWKFLKPGDLVMGCVKCMGLKPGEQIERLGLIRIVDVSRIPLWDMTPDECAKEGFPDMAPEEFRTMFEREMNCAWNEIVTRIEFEYVDEAEHKGSAL